VLEKQKYLIISKNGNKQQEEIQKIDVKLFKNLNTMLDLLAKHVNRSKGKDRMV
jgi:hypothetical protein